MTETGEIHEKREDMQHIERLFPEMKQIKDSNLRKKVAQVWVRMWRKGSWERVEQVPFTPSRTKVTLAQHTSTVTQYAIEIAKVASQAHGIDINMDNLIAGAILHDVSKLVETGEKGKTEIGEKLQHGFYGAFAALEVGLSLEIAHLVATHTIRSSVYPKSVEGFIIRYADMLDADIIHWRTDKNYLLARLRLSE